MRKSLKLMSRSEIVVLYIEALKLLYVSVCQNPRTEN